MRLKKNIDEILENYENKRDISKYDFKIKGLEDFKSIFEYEDDSKNVAVVTHPGWFSFYKSHIKTFEESYNFRCEQSSKFKEKLPNLNESNHIKYLIAETHHSNDNKFALVGRQQKLELKLFKDLKDKNIPTIILVPITPINKRKNEFKIGGALDEKKYIQYLKTIKGERENFYLVPTLYRTYHDFEFKAEGKIYLDSRNSNCMEQSSYVLEFLRNINNKKILFSGNDVGSCFNATLEYFFYLKSEINILTRYSGLNSGLREKFPNDISLNSMDEKIENDILEKHHLAIHRFILNKVHKKVIKNKKYEINSNLKINYYEELIEIEDLL